MVITEAESFASARQGPLDKGERRFGIGFTSCVKLQHTPILAIWCDATYQVIVSICQDAEFFAELAEKACFAQFRLIHDRDFPSMQKELITEVAGTIWTVDAKPGDSVAAGESVVTVESMKMEIPVELETAGVVDEILVEAGQEVAEGQVVARITVG